MSKYKNPYRPIDPDMASCLRGRSWVLRKLDNTLLHVEEPSPISILAERGIGGQKIIKKYLEKRRMHLSLRVVECDIKGDFKQGGNAVDFYLMLVRQVHLQLSTLPAEATQIAMRLENNPATDLYDIEADFWRFFEKINEFDPQNPVLIVFYSFDRLPKLFAFDALDWTFLKDLYVNLKYRLYYLIVSRRTLRYLEHLHGLSRSLFSTIFLPPIRVGLLTEAETLDLITRPGQAVLQLPPWEDWLLELILEWGGRHPYCTEYICSYLFEQIWQSPQKILQPADAELLADQLLKELEPFFDRLFRNLENDQLLRLLVKILIHGYDSLEHERIRELEDLGYFEPQHLKNNKHILFSPLFHQYLVNRQVLPPKLEERPQELEDIETEDIDALSQREFDVLKLLQSNLSQKEIAQKLNVSHNTIKTHTSNIYKKLAVHSRHRAIARAEELDLLS
jgi:DNA-binding CsgD family transcriptional regulator